MSEVLSGIAVGLTIGVGAILYLWQAKAFQRSYNSSQRIPDDLIDRLPCGIILVNKTDKFTYWNRYARQTLFQGPTDIPVDQWTEFYEVYCDEALQHPFEPSEFPVARALKGETVSDVRLFLKGRDGLSYTCLSCASLPIRDDLGRINGAAVIFDNITDTVMLEKERQERHFQGKMGLLGTMASNLAHEINTPLCTISLSNELLQNVSSQEIPSAQCSPPPTVSLGPLNGSSILFKALEITVVNRNQKTTSQLLM